MNTKTGRQPRWDCQYPFGGVVQRSKITREVEFKPRIGMRPNACHPCELSTVSCSVLTLRPTPHAPQRHNNNRWGHTFARRLLKVAEHCFIQENARSRHDRSASRRACHLFDRPSQLRCTRHSCRNAGSAYSARTRRCEHFVVTNDSVLSVAMICIK